MLKLLLLGDSIRLGYREAVAKELEGEFEVWSPEDNCRFAKYTLCHLRGWLDSWGEVPDVIHWNNGLWDTCVRYEEDGCFTSVEDYLRDMLKILRELKKLTPHIIFATTTPPHPAHPNQSAEVIARYNAHIVPILREEGVIINDLNALVSDDLDKYICEDRLHLSEAGVELCGKAVADSVRILAKYTDI